MLSSAPARRGRPADECVDGLSLAELQRTCDYRYLLAKYCLPDVTNHRIAGIEAIDRATSTAVQHMTKLRFQPQAMAAAF